MTDPKTLAHTKNPQTSKDAAEKMVKSGALSRQENQVYNAILRYIENRKAKPAICNPLDFTTKDIAARLQIIYPYHKAYDICRKRFSGLRDRGKIELVYEEKGKHISINRIVKRRDGCRVWRLL